VPKQDPLFGLFFGPSAPSGDSIVNYIAFLLPVYGGGALDLQNLYWTFFAWGHRLSARPSKVLFSCMSRSKI